MSARYADRMVPRTARELSGPARILDLVVGIALTVIGAGVGLIMLNYVTQLGGLSAVCEGVAPEGLRCAPGFLEAMTVAGTAIVVFGWALPAGFLVVRAVRRQRVFWLPIIAIVVMIAGWYVVTGALSAYVPPA